MTDAETIPCNKCNEPVEIVIEEYEENDYENSYEIYCDNEKCDNKTFISSHISEDAIEEWNEVMKDNEAQTLLKMIEGVSPDDGDTMDEIDCRVECIVHGYKFIGMLPNAAFELQGYISSKHWISDCDKYTRSLDAIKAVEDAELQGYHPMIIGVTDGAWLGQCILKEDENTVQHFSSANLPTEYLARLHAVIQALEWKRQNK